MKEIHDFFCEGGKLSQHLSCYEPRKGQLDMAMAVSDILEEPWQQPEHNLARVLLVEAETGIGKTLAYLLPALYSGQRLVISTATINLQDQILNKEIPLLEEVLSERVSALCVKGRQNYLCLYRWHQYSSTPQLSIHDDTSCDMIETWLQETETGDRAELPWLTDRSPLWPKISSHSNQCLGSECPESSLCFVNLLRKKAGSARLLIVNHHLLFSDLALRRGGYGEILPRYEGVIFDEAHHIENVATTFFGRSFSQYQFLDLLGDIERQAELDLVPSKFEKIVSHTRGMKLRIERFSALFPPIKGRFHLQEIINQTEAWQEEIEELARGLERTQELVGAHGNTAEVWNILEKRAEELTRNLLDIGAPEGIEDGYVHWYERRERSITLSATPVNIAEELKRDLYPLINSCIMTSATLTTSGDFGYLRRRLGLDFPIETLHLKSPFDYPRRTLVYIPENGFPEPSQPLYPEMVCHRVSEILMGSRGRALLLFTSFRGMEMMAEYLEKVVPFPLLVQGSASRHLLLEQFKERKETVLLGVASFWEGVDVPGEALSCVIIDKLPFEVPSDPVLQARMAAITTKGGKPFFDFQVPRAILSLRQGVGRLMRSSADRGVIAVMDIRLFSKGYGRSFRKSLPPSPIARSLKDVRDFFINEDY